MKESSIFERIPNLTELGNVAPEGYIYYEKKISPGKPLNLSCACLKWYDIYALDSIISGKQVLETREFLESEDKAGKLKLESELGFVILHRAGAYLLLLLTTWRKTNELWESIYLKKAEQNEEYIPIKFDNDHKGTFCVWEIGVVWHERNAWVRFLKSQMDEKAKLIYLNDMFSGMI